VSDGNRKPEWSGIDPSKIEKLLEIELMQKRAAWQQAKAGRSKVRALSFLFLFLVVASGLLAYFFLFSPESLSELKAAAPQGTPSPTASPR